MPSPERDPGAPKPERREHDVPSYLRAARFAGERPAGTVYFGLQDAIASGPPNDLSVYRMQVARVYHVAVHGEPPPAELDHQITTILAAGEPADLPAEVVQALAQRRRQAIRRSSWTERHYRPGRPL